jgi:arabinan endo-1,5-alpha-L-arabinosidase
MKYFRGMLTNGGVAILIVLTIASTGCKKDSPSTGTGGTDTTGTTTTTKFDINSIGDTYDSVAPFADYLRWGPYNVHDPSIKKFGDYYYCYSTDVGFGISVRSGIQIRRSKDLVQWEFVGWVFSSLPATGAAYIQQKGGTPNDALWAPYVMKVGSTYRLYYALSSNVGRLSVIGLATASNPEGPWTDNGLVVTSANDNTTQTNAIDPTVLVTPANEYYMYYGSAWDGIYMLKLDASSGLAATGGDKGVRIANRGFTSGAYNGNIEGPEIIYNSTLNKYYLFIAYDWLQTKYNTRVCRADNPQGPFYDYNGVDANTNVDHGPMITAPYQFKNHGGWQGVSHVSVFADDNGQFYIAHQGRPSVNSYYMDLHVRKLFWTSDGWPVASPERYAWEGNGVVPKDSLTGNWEYISLGYQVVPGYASTQISPNLQVSTSLTIDVAGTLNGDASSTWTYNAPWLTLKWANGTTDNVFVQRGRDWENKKPNTVIFSGLNNTGTAIWGKQVN